MKVTLPDGTVVEGTKEEIQEYLPPVPQRDWDGPYGPYKITCSATGGPLAAADTGDSPPSGV